MPRGKRLVTPFREIVRLPVVSRRATSTRKSSKFSPLLETETRDLLKTRPVRSHDGHFPFFEHLSLADQRVVRISVSDDRRILACGRRRGKQHAQRGISSWAAYGFGTALVRCHRFLGKAENEQRGIDGAAERAR